MGCAVLPSVMLSRRPGYVVCIKFSTAECCSIFLLLKSGSGTAHGGCAVPSQRSSLASVRTNVNACLVCSRTTLHFQRSSVTRPSSLIPEHRQVAWMQLNTFEHPVRWLKAPQSSMCSAGCLIVFPKIWCGCIQEGCVHSCKTKLLCQNEHLLQGTWDSYRFLRTSAKRQTDFDVIHSSSNRQVHSHCHLPVHDHVSAILRLHAYNISSCNLPWCLVPSLHVVLLLK